jgi:hypothetical protein
MVGPVASPSAVPCALPGPLVRPLAPASEAAPGVAAHVGAAPPRVRCPSRLGSDLVASPSGAVGPLGRPASSP